MKLQRFPSLPFLPLIQVLLLISAPFSFSLPLMPNVKRTKNQEHKEMQLEVTADKKKKSATPAMPWK